MNILITGGTGYIGSHIVSKLIEQKHSLSIVDNFSNSWELVSNNLRHKADSLGAKLQVNKLNICSSHLMKVFEGNAIDLVIHLAGQKSAPESCNNLYKYYKNNIYGTINLLECMREHSVKKMIFSSSAAVYSPENTPPYSEESKCGPQNPYATTKLCIEYILQDYVRHHGMRIKALRYFNPIGAESFSLGENPKGKSGNIMQYLFKAIKSGNEFMVYGQDYTTRDGTCERDYIHILDLIDCHIGELENFNQGYELMNVGTGKGTTVLEMIGLAEEATLRKCNYRIVGRRDGDAGISICKPNPKLEKYITRSLLEAVQSAWDFYFSNK